MTAIVAVARDAASAGAAVLRSRRGDYGAVRSKCSPTDFVSEADIASGIAVVTTIRATYPTASIIVEEPEVHEILGFEPGRLDDQEVWVVDPLDGTTSFLHGFPCYSVSIALLREGRPVAGAVHNVASNECFSAAEGHGASRDGTAIACTTVSSLRDSLLVTGFPYDRGEPLDRQLEVLKAFLRSPVHGIRRDGSAAVDCCHVAAGNADGFWEYALQPWDTAAGAVICAEAGALVSDLDGAPWSVESRGICVANPVLHGRMLEIIQGAEYHSDRQNQ
jgi:myo-inositol-1(or 4)-monophosphatase